MKEVEDGIAGLPPGWAGQAGGGRSPGSGGGERMQVGALPQDKPV